MMKRTLPGGSKDNTKYSAHASANKSEKECVRQHLPVEGLLPNESDQQSCGFRLKAMLAKTSNAVRNGYAASMASIVSVFLLMWLRTTMSYQHVHGISMHEAMAALYADGGIGRFYKGLVPALVMMPLARFGDVFCNEASREFLGDKLSAGVVTAVASTMAACWRILISPFDTVKTLMQVHGSAAMPLLYAKIRKMGFLALYEGAFGAATATWVGHYPWFVTHNFLEAFCVRRMILDAHLPNSTSTRKHVRRALVGLCSSLNSDVCSNAIRVLKTFKQTSAEPITYKDAALQIIAETGVFGLFFRGLSSKLASNALNAMLFTVVWKAIAERMAENNKKREKEKSYNVEEFELEAEPLCGGIEEETEMGTRSSCRTRTP